MLSRSGATLIHEGQRFWAAHVAGLQSVKLETAVFDQLLDWLSRKTTPDTVGFSAKTIGIGATALCLRRGSYLAVLLDEHKLPDPRIGSPGISMIADSEMKRINLECSANLGA